MKRRCSNAGIWVPAQVNQRTTCLALPVKGHVVLHCIHGEQQNKLYCGCSGGCRCCSTSTRTEISMKRITPGSVPPLLLGERQSRVFCFTSSTWNELTDRMGCGVYGLAGNAETVDDLATSSQPVIQSLSQSVSPGTATAAPL